VMTTETTCLSSIWHTDEKVREYYRIHEREGDYRELKPLAPACYDGMIDVDLSMVEPMIAMPFHPGNTYTIRGLIENAADIFALVEKDARAIMGEKADYRIRDKIRGKDILVDQGIIAGCAGGTFENIFEAAAILAGKNPGNSDFSLSVYPQSQPVNYELNRAGVIGRLMDTGVLMKTAFCGPCFGAGDVPGNNALSIRHTTRNFPNREGSKPGQGQIAGVALMDARSIAATAANGGILTPATQTGYTIGEHDYAFNGQIYRNRVYNGYQKPLDVELKYGPGIKDWPVMGKLSRNLLLMAAAVIHDPVTTTDELIPSGETSSYRSDPLRLAEFTLSRKDPLYVGRAKKAMGMEKERASGTLRKYEGLDLGDTGIGSFIYATKPGDGSAREQAASCQRVLGGMANVALDYATKRYRSNLVNWGILPFVVDSPPDLEPGDFLYLPGIREVVETGKEQILALLLKKGMTQEIVLRLPRLTDDERKIILSGCLMNHYKRD
ncbi:MAG: hydratase, partial [Clostridia bacterium]